MTIPTITTFIAPKYLHYDLRKQYMVDHNVNQFQHISYLSLDQYLDLHLLSPKQNQAQQQIKLYFLLEGIESPIFQAVLQTPSFLQELLTIMNTLLTNEIDIASFPEDTASRKELKDILLRMRANMMFPSDERAMCMQEVLHQKDLSHLCFVHVIPQNKQEERFFTSLQERGVQIKDYHLKDIQSEYRYALNIRQEVEAVAQQISLLLHQGTSSEDIAIVVSNLPTYIPFIELVFDRYHIPYTMLGQEDNTQLKRFFYSLLAYFESPSTKTYLDFLSNPILGIPYIKELSQYVQHFSLALEDMVQPFTQASLLNDHINLYTKKSLLALEDLANQAQVHYLTHLSSLFSANLFFPYSPSSISPAYASSSYASFSSLSSSFSHLLLSWYRFLVEKQNQLTAFDVSYLQAIRFTFDPLLDDYDRLPLSLACQFALDTQANVRIEKQRVRPSVVITDIKRPPLPVTYGFALGFYQPTYPNFTSLGGIMDEAIAALLPNFEPLATRYHRHLNTYQDNLHFAQHVVFSYPQGNFEGKVYESSLDLELQFSLGKASPWVLLENEANASVTHSLDPDLARQLFIHDNELTGSISRFENYFRCPYAFFLKYGLQLKDPVRFSLKEAEVGQIYHGFFEDMVTKRKKDYVLATEEEISSYLTAVLAPYKAVFAKEARLFELVEEQLHYQIQSALHQLKKMEDHTSFAPVMVEKNFDYVITQYEDIAIRLKGIIDRIDTISDGVRVLDYKSSAKSLRLDDFYAGLALQLVTYTHIASAITQKRPFGAYFVNLSQPSSTHQPFHIDRRKKIVTYIDEHDFVEENTVPVKLKGLTMVEKPEDIELLDASQSMIAGLSYRKTGKNPGPTVRNPVDWSILSADLLALYEELARRLMEGNIDLTPVEGACNYCSFKVICHFHGKGMKPKPFIYRSTKEEEVSE